jgi:hypothetical protein
MQHDRIARVLLLSTVVGLAGTVLCGVGWYFARTAPVTPDRLSPDDRQALVSDMVAVSPGVFRPAYFCPPMGYTLRPRADLTEWDDSFRTNELGFRAGPAKKAPGTYRVLFVGDSWTFGLGVAGEQAFAKVFERLANNYSGLGQSVEAWNLGQPGYNTFNQMAALWFFFEQLEPDAVIICPTTNDNHSTSTILPNGSQWRDGQLRDLFGDPHVITYRLRRFHSHRFLTRWRIAFERIRSAEQRLQRLALPTMYCFVAIWSEEWVHGTVAEANLASPYVIVPAKYNAGEWSLPPPLRHGTPEAHEIYGRIVYDGFSQMMGWGRAPAETAAVHTSLYAEPPAGEDWVALRDLGHLKRSKKYVPTSFEPSADSLRQCAGAMDERTGRMARATTILVRRAKGSRRLVLTLRRLGDAPSLYPLQLTVSIPSAGGGTRQTFEVFDHQRPRQHIEVEIPEDVPVDSALDVVLEVDRVVKTKKLTNARSLYVESIDPVS